MRTVLLSICIFIASSLSAQRACVSTIYTDEIKSIDPSFSNKTNEIEQFIRRQTIASNSLRVAGAGAGAIRIPVVVHVLYKDAWQNISDKQIQTQIEALNRDFRRKNSDTVNTPDRFKPLAADVFIEFYLATADPKGRATNGIVRKQTGVGEWKMDDKIKFSAQGGDDAWDTRSYLNFWVGSMKGLLGYSSAPGSPADRDGIVISTTAFGTINVSGPYDLGRTAVHETGHWLGLKHIWGDSYCGDDLVDDTPKQGNFTTGCPSGFRSSCSNGSMGDMYMNYMDFTNDACMNLFSEGQKQRMLALFNGGGPRNSLLTSKGLSQPWTEEVSNPEEAPPSNTQFKFYPNPASAEMVLNFEYNSSWIGKTIAIVNLNGTVLSRIQVTSKNQKINIASLKSGMYFIQGESEGEKIIQKFIKL